MKPVALEKDCATTGVSEWRREHSVALKEWSQDVAKRWEEYVVPPMEQAKQLALLDSFRELQRGWDTYGAEPPSAAAINNAKRIIRVLWATEVGAKIRLSPSVEGGVGIIFSTTDKRYADIECFNDGEVLAITSEPAAEPVVWSVDINADSLRQAISRITAFLNG